MGRIRVALGFRELIIDEPAIRARSPLATDLTCKSAVTSTGPELDKRRPVLVVSADARNERANDVIVVPCSTKMREAPTHVRLRRGEGGLPQDCVLKCEQITTVKKYDIDPGASGRGP